MNLLALMLALIVMDPPPCETDEECALELAADPSEILYQQHRAAAAALMHVRLPGGLPIDNLEPD